MKIWNKGLQLEAMRIQSEGLKRKSRGITNAFNDYMVESDDIGPSEVEAADLSEEEELLQNSTQEFHLGIDDMSSDKDDDSGTASNEVNSMVYATFFLIYTSPTLHTLYRMKTICRNLMNFT